MMKKIFLLLLTLCLALCVTPGWALDITTSKDLTDACTVNTDNYENYYTLQSNYDVLNFKGDIELDKGLRFSNNEVTINGNGHKLSLKSGSKAAVIKIDYNTASINGLTIEGGNNVYNENKKVSNTGSGGGIDAENCTLTVTNCNFKGNKADGNPNYSYYGYGGGGIYALSSTLNVKNCRFENNESVNGGGIFCASNSTATIKQCTFYNNTATNEGGGVYIFIDPNNTIENCTFYNNIANENPGDSNELYVDGTTYTTNKERINVNYCTFVNSTNSTNSEIGYMLYNQGSATINNSIIYGYIKEKNEDGNNLVILSNCLSKDKIPSMPVSEDVDVKSDDITIKHIVFRNYDQLFNARGKGGEPIIETDQLGKTRANPPSIGAVEIVKPEHTHSFTYSASGATITATCNSTVGDCDLLDKKATLTVVAPTNLEYNGEAKSATISGSIPNVSNPEIKYSPSSPVNAGDYTASITLGNATASVNFTITKKTATVTAKAQTVELNGSIQTGTGQAELSNAISGHSLFSVTLTAGSTASATTSGTITPSNAKIKDGSGNDVTANYNITYKTGTLTVNQAAITLSSLNIAFDNNAWAKSICQGETATANFKTTVTAAYSDGKNETVSSPALTLNKSGAWPSWLTFSENGGKITVTANPGTDAATGETTHYLDVTASYGGKTAAARLTLTVNVQATKNSIDLRFLNDPITMTVEQAGYAEMMFISRRDYACDYIEGDGQKASLAPTWSLDEAPSWLSVREGVLVADLRKVNVEPGEYTATLKATANYMGVTATATAQVKVTVTGYTELEVTAPDSVMVVYAGFSESRLDLKPLITVRGLHSVRGWETVNYSSREIAQSGNWPSWLTIEDFVAVGKAPAGTEPGNYEYEYEVTVNKDNMFGTGKCRLTVYVSDKSELEPAKITMDSDALPYAQEGTPYSAKIYATGDAPIKWTVDSNTPLPDGLTLNENTGEISGTPTAKNAGQIKGSLIYVSNPANASNPDQRYFIIAVQGVPPSDWKITRNPVKVSKGETFEVTFRVTKGRSVYYSTTEYPDKTYLKKAIAQNSSEAGEGYIKYTLVWPEKKEQKYKFQVKATNKYGWSTKSKTVTVLSTGKIASVGDDIDYGFITIAEDDDEYEDSGTYANGYTTDNIETESGVTYFADGGSDSDGNITGVIGGSSSYKTLEAFIASLKEEELSKVIRLEFRKGAEDSIITAEDLEKFTGLTELAIDESQNLAGIKLDGNKTLQSVTVFDCPALEEIYAGNCTALLLLGASKCPKLADINVDGCQSLETLWLDGSAVKKLDLSGSEFANISNIDVTGCRSLDVLNVDGCKALSDLYAPYTAVTNLNLSNNPELTDVFLNQTKVSTLDLSKNAKLKSLSLVGAENLEDLKIADGVQLEDFNLSGSKVTALNYNGNTKIVSLDLSSNTQLTSLDLTGCTGLKELNITGTDISSLTLKGCSSLEILRASNCKNLTSLNLDDCPDMKEIYLNGSGVTDFPAIKCTDLRELNMSGTGIDKLVLSECYSLESLRAVNCANLTSLNLDDCSSMKEIYLSGSGIKTLDAGACAKLVSLDVSACTALASLNAKGCSLAYLNVTGCDSLAELDCSNNRLGWLNLDGLSKLDSPDYSGQKISGWVADTKMKLNDYIGNNDINRITDILASGANEVGIETTIQDSDGKVIKADETEYYAVFGSVPEKVVYYYDTKFNGEPMDVTLAGGSVERDGANGSGGGCLLSRNEAGAPLAEAGSRKYLVLALFLLGFMEFALKKKSGSKKQ